MADVLLALLLSGFMGLVGQGIRAAVGLKSAARLSASAPSQQTQFDAAYFGLSFMIGFIAGVLAGIGIGLDQVLGVKPTDIKVLLGIAAAGYAGADFIENAFTSLIPRLSSPPPRPEQAGPGAAALAPPPPVPDGAVFTGLPEALKTTSPKVNTTIWGPALSTAFRKYGITSNRSIAAAVGQFLVEAGSAFQDIKENLNYTHANRLQEIFPATFFTLTSAESYVGRPEETANLVYANRLGNGDEASGDGYRYRGRGLIQLTGRTEYEQFAASVGKSLDEALAYCETPEGAAMSGCWYFSSRGCVPLAESWQLSQITRRVNGPKMLGDAQRIEYANTMLKALGG